MVIAQVPPLKVVRKVRWSRRASNGPSRLQLIDISPLIGPPEHPIERLSLSIKRDKAINAVRSKLAPLHHPSDQVSSIDASPTSMESYISNHTADPITSDTDPNTLDTLSASAVVDDSYTRNITVERKPTPPDVLYRPIFREDSRVQDALLACLSPCVSFPPPCARALFQNSITRFESLTSLVVKTGNRPKGLFLRKESNPLRPKEALGFYGGRITHIGGPYVFELSDHVNGFRNIDGAADPFNPMSIFGLMNEDLMGETCNVGIDRNGLVTALRRILPGEELLIRYDDCYDWSARKAAALADLKDEILNIFPWTAEKLSNISYPSLKGARDILRRHLKVIVDGELDPKCMHSVVNSPDWVHTTGLALYLSSHEVLKFSLGNFGEATPPIATIPIPKRGLALFTSCWNTENLAEIPAWVVIRDNPGIRNLHGELDKAFAKVRNTTEKLGTTPLAITHGRIRLVLHLGNSRLKKQRLTTLAECTDSAAVTNILRSAYIWKLCIKEDEDIEDKIPGFGYCGAIAIDQLVRKSAFPTDILTKEGATAVADSLDLILESCPGQFVVHSHSYLRVKDPPKRSWFLSGTNSIKTITFGWALQKRTTSIPMCFAVNRGQEGSHVGRPPMSLALFNCLRAPSPSIVLRRRWVNS